LGEKLSRRGVLAAAGAAAGSAFVPHPAAAAEPAKPPTALFTYGLNTATIRGHKLPLDQEIDIAIKAGYDSIEPWLDNMHRFAEGGGSLKELGKKAADRGLKIVSAIGFAEWIVDDDARRAKGLEAAKVDMDLVKQLGGHHIAAPAAGAQVPIPLKVIAERYRTLLEIGHDLGVVPEAEVWGFALNMTTLADTLFVAAQAGHPDACVLPDIYHLYKGGTPPESVRLISRSTIVNMHVNDYPDAPRSLINDGQRVYPGDGVAPYTKILRALAENHCQVALSFEVFNSDYYKQDPLLVARTGLEKTRAVVAAAFA
jgi:2-keto-myo-inositol isomerase